MCECYSGSSTCSSSARKKLFLFFLLFVERGERMSKGRREVLGVVLGKRLCLLRGEFIRQGIQDARVYIIKRAMGYEQMGRRNKGCCCRDVKRKA